jgi:hypothetical protein
MSVPPVEIGEQVFYESLMPEVEPEVHGVNEGDEREAQTRLDGQIVESVLHAADMRLMDTSGVSHRALSLEVPLHQVGDELASMA